MSLMLESLLLPTCFVLMRPEGQGHRTERGWHSSVYLHNFYKITSTDNMTHEVERHQHAPSKCQSTSISGFFFYASIALVSLGRFFSSLIYTESVGLFGWVISPSQGRYPHTGQNKHKQRINAHRYPCLEWDSNPRSQCSSERRQFMP
jgi:hypothetical protein